MRVSAGRLAKNPLAPPAALGYASRVSFRIARCLWSHATTLVIVHPIGVTGDRKPSSGTRSQDVQFNIETEREADGRWIAEIPEIPGALAYGKTEQEAVAKASAIALRTLADKVEKSRRRERVGPVMLSEG